MARTCLIIPCFNEEYRLDKGTFLDFVTANPEMDLFFVNDGSQDGTAGVLEQMVRNRPDRIKALDLARNGGKAEAIRAATGVLMTWKRFDFAGYFDADLSAPLHVVFELQRELEHQPQYDLALGSRVALLGRTIRRDPRRHYLGRVFATAVSLMLRLPVYDTQCGAKLFRTGLIPQLFSEPFVTRWFFDVEIIFRILRARGREAGADAIVEVPLSTWTDRGGSKLTVVDFIRTPIELWRIRRHYR